MKQNSVMDLQVFQRAYQVSLEVHRVSLEFPRIEQYGLADQVRRASKSICANLAEGYAKRAHSQPEFRRYLLMALGSSDEMQVWSSYCRDLGYVEQSVTRRWQDEYASISKMLQTLIQRVKEASAER
jgi:four helix bundle protein